MEISPAALDLDPYPRDAESRAHFESTAYDAWDRPKETRLERPLYSRHNPGHEQAFVQSLVARHRMPRGARLLDIACGNGFYANEFANAGLRVTAADLSVAAIGYARRMHEPRVEWMAADALTLPFENEFDYAFCHYFTLFNAAAGPREGIDYGRALMRYVRPGGTLLFVWHSDFTAIRLPGGNRFGMTNFTIKQIEAMFPDFRVASHAIDGAARLTAYLGQHAYNKYLTRLCCAGGYFAASNWHHARIITAVHK